jgi:hypothetical protein
VIFFVSKDVDQLLNAFQLGSYFKGQLEVSISSRPLITTYLQDLLTVFVSDVDVNMRVVGQHRWDGV